MAGCRQKWRHQTDEDNGRFSLAIINDISAVMSCEGNTEETRRLKREALANALAIGV